MSISPTEYSASLRIGSVEFVSSDQIDVVLDLETPDGVAANAGVPRAFPQVNGYVLIAAGSGHIVSQVEWITVEHSSFPKRKGFQDYGLIDLPFPLRKMRVNPLGILKQDGDSFSFARGVHAFPSVGEPVLIPTDEQLKAIVETGENKHVKIGTSPMMANAEVKVDPDKLFGQHLAVLGNTGSGKSCSVAGLIQWSMQVAEKEAPKNLKPNARFIVLDPNGEYSSVFKKSARVFQVGSTKPNQPLKAPLWFWNSAEWISFTKASSGAQAPLLRRALRSMRNRDYQATVHVSIEIKDFLGSVLEKVRTEKKNGKLWTGYKESIRFLDDISGWLGDIRHLEQKLYEDNERLNSLISVLENYKNIREKSDKNPYPRIQASHEEIDKIINEMEIAFYFFNGVEKEILSMSEDIPIKFSGQDFLNYFELLSKSSSSSQYMEYLLTRIRTMLEDARMNEIIGDDEELKLDEWLKDYIGGNEAENGYVTVIDLSLVPTEIVHLVTAVVARMVFEALQRYRKLEGKSLPTVLVMEEAHTFIKRYKEDSEVQSASSICCQVFEKIAREGRKFGLGLVLSSQRPSELSPTVLSQCNSFLLHRISNDRDQELIGRLVPDNLRGLLRELPSLPAQHAILLGWASELPVMVRMNDLKKCERPQSDNPDFWKVWTGQEKRPIDWKKIVKDWQGKQIDDSEPPEQDGEI
ncbi:MAG: DUF87 domain-containing protein [Gammaproteobacteria bacterium AqS3]|nr:DUF87 domain-containing protein [Gammaproteobacteria bacterium AqS3]